MNLVSFEFLIFIAFVIVIYYLFPRRGQWIVLLTFSFIFYIMQSSLLYLSISSISTYLLSIWIEKDKNDSRNKIKVTVGIIINLSLLVILKYDLLSYIDNGISLLMPLGISYYTLSTISYLVDTYKKQIVPDGFFSFFLTIAFFPTLIQGPIVRYQKVKKSMFEEHRFHKDKFVNGSLRILWGFFKKLLIATPLNLITTYIVTSEIGGFGIVLGLLLYGIEIYADFSSGIDIIMGFSKILQLDLQENFDAPYFSKNLNEFWKRWHISLTSWFRDYVYIPLGGNRCSKFRNATNILIVFILSGMWHGPTFLFFLWGMIHGLIMIIEKFSHYHPKKTIFIFINYFIVSFLWIFFMYPNLASIMNVINNTSVSLPFLDIMSLSNYIILTLSILFLIYVDYRKHKGKKCDFQYRHRDYILLILFVFIIILLGSYGIGFHKTDFIYSRF